MEAAGDVISSIAVDWVGMNVRVKFGVSTLNSGRIIRLLPVAPILRTFVQYLLAFCSRPEAVSNVICGRFGRLIISDK